MSGFRSYDDLVAAVAGGSGVFSDARWKVFGPDLHPVLETSGSGNFWSLTWRISVNYIALPFGTGRIPVIRPLLGNPLLGPPLPDVRPPTPAHVVIK